MMKKVKFVGSDTKTVLKGKYALIDGYLEKTLCPKEKMTSINVETVSGVINIEITDDKGEKVFYEKITDSQSFTVPSAGKFRVKISAENHSGSFEIK